jgi:hypothetical protein
MLRLRHGPIDSLADRLTFMEALLLDAMTPGAGPAETGAVKREPGHRTDAEGRLLAWLDAAEF